jgi:hypothetical protein
LVVVGAVNRLHHFLEHAEALTMNTAIAVAQSTPSEAVRARSTSLARVDRRAGCEFTRATAEGIFSVVTHGSIGIDAEPGLVIRVHAGCLWVPRRDEHGSVAIGAGEHFVVDRASKLKALASSRAQVELEWPERERFSTNLN